MKLVKNTNKMNVNTLKKIEYGVFILGLILIFAISGQVLSVNQGIVFILILLSFQTWLFYKYNALGLGKKFLMHEQKTCLGVTKFYRLLFGSDYIRLFISDLTAGASCKEDKVISITCFHPLIAFERASYLLKY